jgi:parvulin-like peptidyl-prolyl isomerase
VTSDQKILAALLAALVIGGGSYAYFARQGSAPQAGGAPAKPAEPLDQRSLAFLTGGAGPLNYEDLAAVAAQLPGAQRQAVLDDPKAFSNLVREEAIRKSLLSSALTAGINREPGIEYQLRRQAQQMVINALLERHTALEPGWPGAEELKAYYEQNKDQFKTPERLRVWQIFLKALPDTDPAEMQRIEKRAQEVSDLLRKGRFEWNDSVKKYSEHAPSKDKQGDLGEVPVRDLQTEFRDRLLAMKEGEISDPVRTAHGFHILRRGVLLPEQVQDFDKLEPALREQLRRQSVQTRRAALYRQVFEQYPVDIAQASLEQWRTRLGGK